MKPIKLKVYSQAARNHGIYRHLFKIAFLVGDITQLNQSAPAITWPVFERLKYIDLRPLRDGPLLAQQLIKGDF